MEKKPYTKPAMQVYDLPAPTRLLVGSNGEPNGYPGNLGYVPGLDQNAFT